MELQHYQPGGLLLLNLQPTSLINVVNNDGMSRLIDDVEPTASHPTFRKL